ncbi:MAG: DUF4349 domain-containing protein [Oscillospiraceae bacterium]|nr:DUF4349 domain-containing protein [Oscillospiraceae bacterium]
MKKIGRGDVYMKNLLKAKLLVAAALFTVLLAGCGDSGGRDSFAYFSESTNGSSGYKSDASAYTNSSSAAYDSDGYYADEAASSDYAAKNDEESSGSLAADSIQKEMLVYSCYMDVDTLDFDASLNSFKNTLDMYGGFVETENFNDGGGGGRWYYENEEKWQSYSATVRIPSSNYDAFCNSAGSLGDLRSKTSTVENLSQEYSDLSTSLEIYEAKEQRYIALLADITEDEYAVEIERELTNIQIQIANIKTRMNRISTDVAYSYVYFTLNEVKEYVSAPVKTDTFFDRLSNTLSNAGRGFLEFLEGLLFFLIYTVPYFVLIGIVVFVIVKIVKKRRAKKREKKLLEKQANQAAEKSEEKASGTADNAPPAEEQKPAEPENKDVSEDGSEEKKP